MVVLFSFLHTIRVSFSTSMNTTCQQAPQRMCTDLIAIMTTITTTTTIATMPTRQQQQLHNQCMCMDLTAIMITIMMLRHCSRLLTILTLLLL